MISMKLSNIIEEYQTELQLNKSIAYLINPTAVMALGLERFPLSSQEFQEQAIEIGYSPILPIEQINGVPCIFGNPIWERLEEEDMHAFGIFQLYRNMGRSQTRTLSCLSKVTGEAIGILREYRVAYHWEARVRAYDQYIIDEHEQLLKFKRIELMGKHAKAGEKVFQIATDFLEQNSNLLTPKLAIEMLKTAVSLERLSHGMEPNTTAVAHRLAEGSKGKPATQLVGQQQYNVQINNEAEQKEQKLPEDKERLKQLLGVLDRVGALHVIEGEGVMVDGEIRPDRSTGQSANSADITNPSAKT